MLMTAMAAADEKKADVHVVVPGEYPLPKAHLIVYRVPDKNNDWPIVATDVARQGEVDVTSSLPAGRYVAEIGAASDQQVVLLRSTPFDVPGTERVVLTAEKHPVDAAIGTSAAKVRQLAIRRWGNGEVRWSGDRPVPPEVVTSPGVSYVVSCVAEQGTTHMAVWLPPQSIKSLGIHFNDTVATHRLKFAIRPGTPPLSTSRVTIFFPDAHVRIEQPALATFITNRDRALVDYEIETAAKEKLAFGWDPTLIEKSSKFEFGGPLKPRMFAAFIWADNGKWEPGDVFTRLEMVDAEGRLLDYNRSHFGFHDEKFYAPGKEPPVPLEKRKPDWNGFKADVLRATVHYDYGGEKMTATCKGEGPVRVHSEHFSLETPPQWMFKARQFLSCCEAIRMLTRKNTGRRGPESFKIDWRSNGNNAKSIVGNPGGGGHNIWMSFPYWTFETFWDPFNEPWFGDHDPYVCHETLHTFGYNHGDEMSHLEWRGEDQYRTFRWHAVDTGVWPVWADPVRVDGEK